METLVDQSIRVIRNVAQIIGKKPLADRAGLSDALLRQVNSPDYSPTARTLRKLELAAKEVLAERQADCPAAPSREEAA